MKTRMLSAVSAAALSLSVLSGVAFAQDLGLKQLQDSQTSAMAQLNMDTSMVDSLTLEELTRIQGVTSGTTAENSKVLAIETILRDADARIAAGGAVVPTGTLGDITTEDLAGDMVVKANVGAYIAQLGLNDQIDVEALSTDQLLQVQLIQGSSEGEAQQRMKVEQLLLN